MIFVYIILCCILFSSYLIVIADIDTNMYESKKEVFIDLIPFKIFITYVLRIIKNFRELK